MAQISARGVALAALETWRTKKKFADTIISEALVESNLRSADRAFALDLFYGVLRNLTLLDFWIGSLRNDNIDVSLRDFLRLGLYQLFIANTREHAAVNETVGLASKCHRPIVNAILRSAVRDRHSLKQKADVQPLHTRTSHPEFLIQRWQKQFGAAATAALCEWNNRPPPTYARINQLKLSRPSFLDRYNVARSLSKISNFVELSFPTEALTTGDCYVQDPSTAIACELLQPKPSDKVLDACAAPGGKTSYLAELMQNCGLLIATDRDPQRITLLAENLARLGISNAKVLSQDWTKPEISSDVSTNAPFDGILVDAPCSNTGVMRRRVDVRWRLRPADFTRMQALQIEILRTVASLLKRDGILVYSTCSLEKEENEDVVAKLVRTMPVLKLEEQKISTPFRDGFDGAFAAKLRRVR